MRIIFVLYGVALFFWSDAFAAHKEVAMIKKSRDECKQRRKRIGFDLMSAAKRGDADKARALIAAKAPLDIQDKNCWTPLIMASYWGYIDVAQALIAGKAQLDIRSKKGRTALMAAAWEGHTGVAQALIAGKAQLDIQDEFGDTALMIAVYRGHTNVELLLREAEANELSLRAAHRSRCERCRILCEQCVIL